jgi:hypothetical protein
MHFEKGRVRRIPSGRDSWRALRAGGRERSSERELQYEKKKERKKKKGPRR